MRMRTIALLLALGGCDENTTPTRPTPMPDPAMPDPGDPTTPDPGIPEPFPIVSGTYTGVLTYREPTTGCTIHGNSTFRVYQGGNQLTVHGGVGFPQSDCAEGSFQGGAFGRLRWHGTLEERRLRTSLEWDPDGDANTHNPSNCGYPYGAPSATLTLLSDGTIVGRLGPPLYSATMYSSRRTQLASRVVRRVSRQSAGDAGVEASGVVRAPSAGGFSGSQRASRFVVDVARFGRFDRGAPRVFAVCAVARPLTPAGHQAPDLWRPATCHRPRCHGAHEYAPAVGSLRPCE